MTSRKGKFENKFSNFVVLGFLPPKGGRQFGKPNQPQFHEKGSFCKTKATVFKMSEKEEKKRTAAKTGEVERLQKIWSRRMAVDGYKKVYLASLEGTRTEILDDNGDVVEVKYNPSAANAATKALDALCRLLGYSSPPEPTDEADGEITVELGEAEEYSK